MEKQKNVPNHQPDQVRWDLISSTTSEGCKIIQIGDQKCWIWTSWLKEWKDITNIRTNQIKIGQVSDAWYRNDLQFSVANIPKVFSQIQAAISAHFDNQPGN